MHPEFDHAVRVVRQMRVTSGIEELLGARERVEPRPPAVWTERGVVKEATTFHTPVGLIWHGGRHVCGVVLLVVERNKGAKRVLLWNADELVFRLEVCFDTD